MVTIKKAHDLWIQWISGCLFIYLFTCLFDDKVHNGHEPEVVTSDNAGQDNLNGKMAQITLIVELQIKKVSNFLTDDGGLFLTKHARVSKL